MDNPEIFEIRNAASTNGNLNGATFADVDPGDLVLFFIGGDTGKISVMDASVAQVTPALQLDLAPLVVTSGGDLVFECWWAVGDNTYPASGSEIVVNFEDNSVGAASVMAISIKNTTNALDRSGFSVEHGATNGISVATTFATAAAGDVVIAGVSALATSYDDDPDVGLLIHEALGSAIETSTSYQGGLFSVQGPDTVAGIQHESWSAIGNVSKAAIIVAFVPTGSTPPGPSTDRLLPMSVSPQLGM